MAKIVVWIVVVFLVLFALRLYNAAKARARARRQPRQSGAQPMVQCVGCGVFLPAPDARRTAEGFRCGDPHCAGNVSR